LLDDMFNAALLVFYLGSRKSVLHQDVDDILHHGVGVGHDLLRGVALVDTIETSLVNVVIVLKTFHAVSMFTLGKIPV